MYFIEHLLENCVKMGFLRPVSCNHIRDNIAMIMTKTESCKPTATTDVKTSMNI